MAQKVVGYVRFQVPAGKATPAPPVGPALGQYGVNIGQFTKDFNERTKGDMGMMIPVVITEEDVRKIAEQKMPDLNCTDIESAISMIAGTCRSMGVVVGD